MQQLSNYPWYLGFGTGLPEGLPREHDTVRVGWALGLPAIDDMVARGAYVGPLRYCLTHAQVLLPVESGTADRWRARHSDCVRGSRPHCAAAAGYFAQCVRLWVAPPSSDLASVTSAAQLHDALSRVYLRPPARTQPVSTPRREACHA